MRSLIALSLAVVSASLLHAQSAETIQRELNGHAERIRVWTSDKVLLDAVKAQNAKKSSLAEIQQHDQSWVAQKNEALVQKVITGTCADRLRELSAKNGYSEAFLSDAQGALVCATAKTSDYWQGDEAKWIQAFKEGKGATFIDRPRLDESAGARFAQISVPILENGRAVGVLTVGVGAGKK